MKQFDELNLKNGLKAGLKKTQDRIIYANLRVNHGALNENKGEEGLAHFLEHCVYLGGSEKYSTKQIENIISAFGNPGAYTNNFYTYYPAEFLQEDLDKYLDFVSEIVFSPRLDGCAMERERQRVLREISDRLQNPNSRIERIWNNAFYGENSPLNNDVIGKETVVASAKKEDLLEFHRRGYSPNNSVLYLVGDLPKNTNELVKKYFSDKAPGLGRKFKYVDITDWMVRK